VLPTDAIPAPTSGAKLATDGEERESRRFTRIVVAMLVIGLAISVGFAVLVDPLRTFGTGLVPSVLTSEHYSKPRSFLKLGPTPEALVLGSSKVMKLNPACIQELTGYRAFNFGLSSSHVEDWAAAYRFARTDGKAAVRELLIGIDIDAFDDHAEPDPRLLSSVYLRRYLDDRWHLSWGVASRALFGWQALRFGLSSVFYHVVPSAMPQARMRFDDQGYSIYDAWEAAMRNGTLDRRPLFAGVAANLHGKLSGKGFDALSPERVALFKQLVRTAHAAGATVDVFIPPFHPELAALRSGPIVARTAECEKLLEELEHEGTVRYLRIHELADFHGDPAEYFDGAHMTETNSSRLLLAIFHREHGCGQ
jgi:hypothetical protein